MNTRIYNRIMAVLCLFLAAILYAVFSDAAQASESWVPANADTAHQYADGILTRRFEASYLEWRAKHPADKKAAWDHIANKTDAGDRERWDHVLADFELLRKAMKHAGYR